MTMSDESIELPEGWILEQIKELCAFNPKQERDLSDTLTVSFVPMSCVSEKTKKIQIHDTKPLGEVRKGYTHFAEEDVIFAKITPCMENGKVAVARNLTNGIACGSTEFHVLRSCGGVIPDYLQCFLSQRKYLDEAAGAMTGVVGQRKLPKEFLDRLYLIYLTAGIGVLLNNLQMLELGQRHFAARLSTMMSVLSPGLQAAL